jgi:hypothetical protein
LGRRKKDLCSVSAMVLRITVLPEQWSVVNEITRDSINTFARGIIACHIEKFDDIERTVITLPRTTTNSQRHNIHRLTTARFNSESYDNEQEDRIMKIILEKVYVQELFRDYVFNPVNQVAVEIEPVSERQRLFDTLIGFINNNFENEFNTYLNSF